MTSPDLDGAVHLHAPPTTYVAVRSLQCSTCERHCPVLVLGYEWYGPSCTCLRCGEAWGDGEIRERPFAPRWRDDNIAAALRTARRHGIDMLPRKAVWPPRRRRKGHS